MSVRIKLLRPEAVMPAYASAGAACFDIAASGPGQPHPADPEAVIYPTALAFEVPEGYVMNVYSRSGHGFKSAVRLSNCVGKIDPDYRGELFVSLTSDGFYQVPEFQRGDRIAQAEIVPCPRVHFEVVEELSETARGVNGLGSTGVKS